MKKYIYMTIIFLAITIIGSYLDSYYRIQNLYSILAKLIITITCTVIIIKRKLFVCKGDFFTKYIIIAMLPVLINLILMYGPVDKRVSNWVAITSFFRVLITAIWEELHFRAIGVDVLKNNSDKITKDNAILLIFIFAFSHSINILLNPNQILVELFRIILSTATGSLFLSLYLKTNNIVVSILSHFCLNYTTLFFNTFSSKPNSLGIIVYDIVYYIGIMMYFYVAIYIIRKNNLVELNNEISSSI